MLQICVTYGTVAVGTTIHSGVCLKNEELVSDIRKRKINHNFEVKLNAIFFIVLA